MDKTEVLSCSDRDDKEIDEYYDKSDNSSGSESSSEDKSSDKQYHSGAPRIPLEVFQNEMRLRTMSSSFASPFSILSSNPESSPLHLSVDAISSCALKISSTLDSKRLYKIRGKYQIPNDVHICLAAEGEWCYTPNSS